MSTQSASEPIAHRILDCFPSGSYALPGLLRLLDIVETDSVESAAVECRAQPRLLINPSFVERSAATPEKLLILVMHELHHVLLGHTRLFPTVTKVDNLVFDAVINALLCRMFPAREHTAFFTDLYRSDEFPECLLRPPDDWAPGQPVSVPPALQPREMVGLAQVYRQLYADKGASYHDLYQALRDMLTEAMVAGVLLIGDHTASGDGSAAGLLEQRSPVLYEIVREIVEQWPQPPDPIAGRSLASILKSVRVRIIEPTRRTLLRRLIRKVADKRLLNGNVRDVTEDAIGIATPIPTFDRRTVVLTALGAPPLLHHGEIAIPRVRPVGQRVHVYLDVSGSIGDLKGALYGAVLDCQEAVHPVVHLFSTKIADVTLTELRRGKCRTTEGTEIACVAEHIAAHEVRRAVVITDGYVGKPAGAHLEQLKRTKLGVALTERTIEQTDLRDVADHWIDLSRALNPSGVN